MIKKSIKKLVNKFGYDIVKKYDSGHSQDAVNYNDLSNVNRRNSDREHFLRMMEYDGILVNKLYENIIKEHLKNEFDYLDIGCGTGILVNLIKQDYLKSNVLGCDFSEEKVKACNEYYNRNIYFVQDILTPIKNQYNYISCTEVLEHLVSPEIALKNIINATQEKGKIFITVPDGRKDSFKGHINFWSPESFQIFITNEMKNSLREFNSTYHIINDKNFVLIELLN